MMCELYQATILQMCFFVVVVVHLISKNKSYITIHFRDTTDERTVRKVPVLIS